MDSLITKAKEHIGEIKAFICFWVFVLFKFIFLKNGYTATFFSLKMCAIVLFCASFAGVVLFAYMAFSKAVTQKQSQAVCAAIIFAYYCCFQSAMLYQLSAEHYFAAAFITLAVVLSFFKKAKFFSLPACIAAILIEPGISVICIPVLISQNAPVKKEIKQKSKAKNKKQKKTVFVKVIETLNKIPDAVYPVAFVLLLAASFVIYRAYHPYEILFSKSSMLNEAQMLLKAILYVLPVFIFSAVIWISFIKIDKAAVKFLVFSSLGAVLCCLSGIIISANDFSAGIYLNAALLATLVLQLKFLCEHIQATEIFCQKYSKAVFPMMLIASIYAGVCNFFIG